MATAISLNELNLLRRDYARVFLVDRCDILRKPAPTEADRGQESSAESVVVASNLWCRLTAKTTKANENANTSQLQSTKDGVLLLKVNVPDILAGDRIRITTRSPIKTFDLEVVGSLNRTDKMKAMIDVMKID
jgi:hypothetical protein